MRKRVFILVLLLLLPIAYSLNLGTARGYVLNTAGGIITDSSVLITVVGCTGSGCNATDASDAGGYYIESNLNLIPGNTVRVAANKSNSFGNNTGIAIGSGSVGFASINITMCSAPQKPSVSSVSDSHNNSLVSMPWTTYKAGLEYDEFQFNSETVNASAVSPQTKVNIAYQVHTWKVRTCASSGCCSDYSTDAFNISNNLPASPALTDQGNTNNNSISLQWTHSGTDSDGDTVSFDLQFDGVTTNGVTSPYAPSGIASGSHTWGVRACDIISCTSFAQDSFSINNDAAATPNLTDQGHTSATSVALTWTNYSDPDADATRNEFQLSTDSNYSTIIANDSNAGSSKTASGLTTFTLYHWRVRTCDTLNACSSYDTDSFFVFEGGNGTGQTIFLPGGTREEEVNITCTPRWECNDWNQCNSRGISTRVCIDANGCLTTIPTDHQYCSYEGPRVEEPSAEAPERFYLGSLDLEEKLVGDIAPMEEWQFIYGGESHMITVLEINDNGVRIKISSEPQEVTIPLNESLKIDLDLDGEFDMEARLVEKNHKTMKVEFVRLHEAKKPRLPISTTILMKDIRNTIQQIGVVPGILFIIIACLIAALTYQYKTFVVREIKIDNRVMKYIQTGKSKGFTDEQIKARLLSNGFPEEEVEYVFHKMIK